MSSSSVSMVTKINFKDGMDLIHELKKLHGARSHDGECSVQVGFNLEDGSFLRFGVTDDDVAGDAAGLMWVDVLDPYPFKRGD